MYKVESPSSQATYLSPLDGPSTKGCGSCDKTSSMVNDIQLKWIHSILELCNQNDNREIPTLTYPSRLQWSSKPNLDLY